MTDKNVGQSSTLIDNDGKTHINIYIRGKTELGRRLTQFHQSAFVHPYFGPFDSMECFWQFIRTKDWPEDQKYVEQTEAEKAEGRDPVLKPMRDDLRHCSGKAAKELGKKLPQAPSADFTEILNTANFYKIIQNPSLKQLMIESTLPFDHYYEQTPGGTVVRPKYSRKIVKGFADIRLMLRKGESPPEVDYAAFVNRK